MSIATNRTEQRARMLGELADVAMDLARDMAGRAKAAESLEEAERMTRAFDRMARSVRLTLSLEARLERELKSEARAAHGEALDAIQVRRKQVRARLMAVIRAEVPRAERDRLEFELDVSLAEETLYTAFLDGPVETVIARLGVHLRLFEPAAANDGERLSPWRGQGIRPAPS